MGTFTACCCFRITFTAVSLLSFLMILLVIFSFQDRYVREYAIKFIKQASSEFLFNLITQLVEALRFETFENSSLALFLLEHSTKDRRFALELFWFFKS